MAVENINILKNTIQDPGISSFILFISVFLSNPDVLTLKFQFERPRFISINSVANFNRKNLFLIYYFIQLDIMIFNWNMFNLLKRIENPNLIGCREIN